MTKKEFLLISDAIKEGSQSLIDDISIDFVLDEKIDRKQRKESLKKKVRNHLYKSFSERLKYMSDSFDSHKFYISVTL